jgi:hypothetical protein
LITQGRHIQKEKKMFRRREQLLTVDCTAYNSVWPDKYMVHSLVENNIAIPAFVVHDQDLR